MAVNRHRFELQKIIGNLKQTRYDFSKLDTLRSVLVSDKLIMHTRNGPPSSFLWWDNCWFQQIQSV